MAISGRLLHWRLEYEIPNVQLLGFATRISYFCKHIIGQFLYHLNLSRPTFEKYSAARLQQLLQENSANPFIAKTQV